MAHAQTALSEVPQFERSEAVPDGLDGVEGARKLAAYIGENVPLVHFEVSGPRYRHMGGLLADTVLQAGVSYRSVVRPRVARVVQLVEGCSILDLLDSIDLVGAEHLLDWVHWDKPQRLIDLSTLLFNERVYEVPQLSAWLQRPESVAMLEAIRGIGSKTIDYLKLLGGFEVIPIDRHAKSLLAAAGVPVRDYSEASHVLTAAAQRLNVSAASLDRSIWIWASGAGVPQKVW